MKDYKIYFEPEAAEEIAKLLAIPQELIAVEAEVSLSTYKDIDGSLRIDIFPYKVYTRTGSFYLAWKQAKLLEDMGGIYDISESLHDRILEELEDEYIVNRGYLAMKDKEDWELDTGC